MRKMKFIVENILDIFVNHLKYVIFKKNNQGIICIKFSVEVLVGKLGYEIGEEQLVSKLPLFTNYFDSL